MVNPASIPQHVVDHAAAVELYTGRGQAIDPVRVIIAAALDALMDDELVWVDAGHGRDVAVRPSDVLEAVLAR